MLGAAKPWAGFRVFWPESSREGPEINGHGRPGDASVGASVVAVSAQRAAIAVLESGGNVGAVAYGNNVRTGTGHASAAAAVLTEPLRRIRHGRIAWGMAGPRL